MTVGDVMRALARRWIVIAVFAAASAATAAGVTAMQRAEYTATAAGFVSLSRPQDRPPYALASGAQYILERMSSYAELGVTTPVLMPVVDDLRLPGTPLSLSRQVTSHSMAGKAVLEVAVTDSDPRTAAMIADRVLDETNRAIESVENGNVHLLPIGPAATPAQPVNRRLAVNTAVGGAGGLVLGGAVAVLLELWIRRRRPSTHPLGQLVAHR